MNLLVIGKTQWFKSSIWLTLFYAVTISAALSVLLKQYIERKSLWKFLKWGCFAIIICIPLLMFNSRYNPVKRFRMSFMIGNYEKRDLTLMHEWIENNTPVDAVFITSPNDDSFLCEAKRSLIIGYKAVIHEPYFMVPWADAFQRIYNFNVDTIGNSSPLYVASENYKTFYYQPLPDEQLDYRLDNVSECKYLESLGPIVHRQGDYILTKVLKEEDLKGEI